MTLSIIPRYHIFLLYLSIFIFIQIELSHSLRLHIAYQAAKGMNFLHQFNPPIIHRDLKSHSIKLLYSIVTASFIATDILIDDKWNARISDFGITKIKEIKGKRTPKGNQPQSLGTIYWTAPGIKLI